MEDESRTEAATTDPPAVAELRRTGATVLRGAWRLDHLAELRRSIEAFVAWRGAEVARGRASSGHARVHASGGGAGNTMVLSGFLKLDLLRRMFAGSPYHQLCRDHLGDDEFFVQLPRLAFRSPDPRGDRLTVTPWHQDSGTQDPRVGHVLNCWTPLDSGAGRDCPGLELVRTNAAPPRFPLKRPSGEPHDRIAIDHERIIAAFGPDSLWAPELDLGDGLVFTQDVIHRTHITPTMTRPRLGFELRVFSPRHIHRGFSIGDIDGVERLA